MGFFGKSKKDITTSPDGGNYIQAPSTDINNLPVATLISEGPATSYKPTVPIGSAPIAPTSECCDVHPNTASISTNNNNNNLMDDVDLTRLPMNMRECPNCHVSSRTRVTTGPSWQTWAASGFLCFLFWPISWVPLVTDNCKTTEHFCVKCGSNVGKVVPFQDCCVEKRG